MSKLFDDLMTGLNEALNHAKEMNKMKDRYLAVITYDSRNRPVWQVIDRTQDCKVVKEFTDRGLANASARLMNEQERKRG